MKTKLLAVIFALVTCISSAQTVKLKKDMVFVDGKEFMRYETKHYGREFLLYEIGDEEESIFMRFKDPTSTLTNESVYFEIHFVKTGQFMEVRNDIGRSRSEFIQWFIENKLIGFCLWSVFSPTTFSRGHSFWMSPHVFTPRRARPTPLAPGFPLLLRAPAPARPWRGIRCNPWPGASLLHLPSLFRRICVIGVTQLQKK